MITTIYHLQNDRQSERKNQIVELTIWNHMFDHPDQSWIDIMPSLQWRLNNTYSEPIDCSPHKYLFSFKIPDFNDRLLNQNIPEAEEIRYIYEHIRRDIQLAMDTAAIVAKCRYNSYYHQKEFAEGDEVWISQGDMYHL